MNDQLTTGELKWGLILEACLHACQMSKKKKKKKNSSIYTSQGVADLLLLTNIVNKLISIYIDKDERYNKRQLRGIYVQG